jgi:predicted phage gp36 major capsid-like protein
VTTLAVGTDPAGGYLVTPDTSGRIVKKVYESSPMRQVANVVTIGTDALEGPIDNGEMDAQWIGEKAGPRQTDAAQFGKWVIAAHELYAYPWVTQRLLEDANMDVESWIAMKAADKFARKETTAFYTGDGHAEAARRCCPTRLRGHRRRHARLGHVRVRRHRRRSAPSGHHQRHRQAARPDLQAEGGLPPERRSRCAARPWARCAS